MEKAILHRMSHVERSAKRTKKIADRINKRRYYRRIFAKASQEFDSVYILNEGLMPSYLKKFTSGNGRTDKEIIELAGGAFGLSENARFISRIIAPIEEELSKVQVNEEVERHEKRFNAIISRIKMPIIISAIGSLCLAAASFSQGWYGTLGSSLGFASVLALSVATIDYFYGVDKEEIRTLKRQMGYGLSQIKTKLDDLARNADLVYKGKY